MHRATRRLSFLHYHNFSSIVDGINLYNFIGGVRVRPRGCSKILVINPSDSNPLAEVTSSGAEDFTEVASCARDGCKALSGLPRSKRVQLVRTFAKALRREVDRLSIIEALCSGLRVADVKGALHQTVDALAGTTHCEDKDEPNQEAAVSVMLCESPLHLLEGIAQFGADFVQGNASIWKISESSPLSVLALADVVGACEMPPGAFNLVHGGPNVSLNLMLQNAGRLHISNAFDDAAAQQSSLGTRLQKRISVCPCGPSVEVILPNCDPDIVADHIVEMSMVRRSMAHRYTRFVLVPNENALQLVERVAQRAMELKTGHALDPTVAYGPFPSPQKMQLLRDDIHCVATNHGCHVVCGSFKPVSAYIASPPTVLFFDSGQQFPHAASPLHTVNAPVVCMKGYSALEEVGESLNRFPFKGNLYVWGSELSSEHAALPKLPSTVTSQFHVVCRHDPEGKDRHLDASFSQLLRTNSSRP